MRCLLDGEAYALTPSLPSLGLVALGQLVLLNPCLCGPRLGQVALPARPL